MFGESLIEQKIFKSRFKKQRITDENCLWQRVPDSDVKRGQNAKDETQDKTSRPR